MIMRKKNLFQTSSLSCNEFLFVERKIITDKMPGHAFFVM